MTVKLMYTYGKNQLVTSSNGNDSMARATRGSFECCSRVSVISSHVKLVSCLKENKQLVN